jgi:hypothetical protein
MVEVDKFSSSETLKRIAIHGVPRSGTTWLGALFDSSPVLKYLRQPLFSYAFKDALNCNSSEEDIQFFFNLINRSEDEFINQTSQKQKGSIPSFNKENIKFVAYKEARYHHLIPHLLKTDRDLYVILIIRNPLSVLASWVKAPKEFDPMTMKLETEWRKAGLKNGVREEEFYGFDKWKEFALIALEMKRIYPDRCMIIDYRELLNNTKREITECFDFCGIPIEQQTLDFIAISKGNDLSADAYSVYRVNQDDEKWRGALPKSISQEIIQELKGTVLEKYLHEGH